MNVIYDPSISLSKDEISFLLLGPKFSVRQNLNLENFKVELEKMVAKAKFNEDPAV